MDDDADIILDGEISGAINLYTPVFNKDVLIFNEHPTLSDPFTFKSLVTTIVLDDFAGHIDVNISSINETVYLWTLADGHTPKIPLSADAFIDATYQFLFRLLFAEDYGPKPNLSSLVSGYEWACPNNTFMDVDILTGEVYSHNMYVLRSYADKN